MYIDTGQVYRILASSLGSQARGKMFLHQGSIVLDVLRLETLGKIIRLSGKDLKCQLWDLTAAGWAPGGARQSSLEAGCVLGRHSRCTQPHLAKMRELVLEMPGFQAIRRLNL